MPYQDSHIPHFGRTVAPLRDRKVMPMIRQRVREFAEKERQGFQERIQSQRFPSFQEHPLNPAYVARKKAAGRDERVEMATHTYVNSIKVMEKERKPGLWTVFVGFDIADRARDLNNNLTDVSLDTVAKSQEYGVAAIGLPPRPHWKPYLEEMKQRAVAVRTEIRTELMEQVKAARKGAA